MKYPVGIEHHYPPLSPKESGFLIICPLAVLAVYKWGPSAPEGVGVWIGFIAALFGVGWLLEVLKWISQGIERQGYKTAIEDVRSLCVERAAFKDGIIPKPEDLLAAAIVTMEAKSP
jgi:hypothetical protein